MKKVIVIIGLFILFFPSNYYAEDVGLPFIENSFDSSNDLSSRYAKKQVLDGKTTVIKKRKDKIYLTFPFKKQPYQYFASFVLNGPANVYTGFIETIYYRDKVKIKDIYYEKNPVKTNKIGIFTTDLCFTSEENVGYHYKNVPYMVSSDRPTAFFSEINFDEEHARITGKMKMFASKNTYQVELFYTDNEEYHYQESTVAKNGTFTIDLNRNGQLGKMYLRGSDGLGNYANAYDIQKQGKVTYQIAPETLKEIENSHKTMKSKPKFKKLVLLIIRRTLGTIAVILILLRLRVILKRRRRKKLRKKQFHR
jgi:hypothetical protein